jgi:hypothetical protein
MLRVWNRIIGRLFPRKWHFLFVRHTGRGHYQWTAYAKASEFVSNGHFLKEPGDMWFEVGATKEEAFALLWESLKQEGMVWGIAPRIPTVGEIEP